MHLELYYRYFVDQFDVLTETLRSQIKAQFITCCQNLVGKYQFVTPIVMRKCPNTFDSFLTCHFGVGPTAFHFIDFKIPFMPHML